jgi:hypothetical protein
MAITHRATERAIHLEVSGQTTLHLVLFPLRALTSAISKFPTARGRAVSNVLFRRAKRRSQVGYEKRVFARPRLLIRLAQQR